MNNCVLFCSQTSAKEVGVFACNVQGDEEQQHVPGGAGLQLCGQHDTLQRQHVQRAQLQHTVKENENVIATNISVRIKNMVLNVFCLTSKNGCSLFIFFLLHFLTLFSPYSK